MSNTEQSERIAQITAHRACCGTEHNPAEGKLHGYCVVCGVPWPCDYAGTPPPPQPAQEGADLRNMLRAMQNGELTVSRGVELVDMWLAGNYRDEQLPPVREGLGEDEMPWDRIDSLTKQRDELLSLVKGFHRKLETYRNVYSGDKELHRLLAECEEAIAKAKP